MPRVKLKTVRKTFRTTPMIDQFLVHLGELTGDISNAIATALMLIDTEKESTKQIIYNNLRDVETLYHQAKSRIFYFRVTDELNKSIRELAKRHTITFTHLVYHAILHYFRIHHLEIFSQIIHRKWELQIQQKIAHEKINISKKAMEKKIPEKVIEEQIPEKSLEDELLDFLENDL